MPGSGPGGRRQGGRGGRGAGSVPGERGHPWHTDSSPLRLAASSARTREGSGRRAGREASGISPRVGSSRNCSGELESPAGCQAPGEVDEFWSIWALSTVASASHRPLPGAAVPRRGGLHVSGGSGKT